MPHDGDYCPPPGAGELPAGDQHASIQLVDAATGYPGRRWVQHARTGSDAGRRGGMPAPPASGTGTRWKATTTIMRDRLPMPSTEGPPFTTTTGAVGVLKGDQHPAQHIGLVVSRRPQLPVTSTP